MTSALHLVTITLASNPYILQDEYS